MFKKGARRSPRRPIIGENPLIQGSLRGIISKFMTFVGRIKHPLSEIGRPEGLTPYIL